MNKKIIALILAGAMMLPLCACTQQGTISGNATFEPLTREDVIQVNIPSHASWPYQENWKVWEYIEEACGATLEITALPSSDAKSKYPLMFASAETLPDVMSFSTKLRCDQYNEGGAIIALDDMAEYMPNYNKWLDSLSDEEYAQYVTVRKAYDGKVYYTPSRGKEASSGVRAWLYRKDIFEKHDLKVPQTFDELYEVCKQLKKIYPESYPFCLRSAFNHIDSSGPSWKPYWSTGFYYDFNEEKWNYGASEDIMLEVITFLKKMVDEKLMPSDFMTINESTWQELMTTDRGFIMPEYQTRIDFFNGIGRVKNPNYDLQAMIPPIARDGGVAKMNRYTIDPIGMLMCNTKDEGRIANAAKFLDWFYTDEACELISWGKEGETFEVVNGKKKYILDDKGTQPNNLYGFSTYGTYTLLDEEATLALESDEIAETRDMVLSHLHDEPTITTWLAHAPAEKDIISQYATGLNTYTQEMVTKFILGQEPLSKFDDFVAALDELGLQELLKAYETSYNNVK